MMRKLFFLIFFALLGCQPSNVSVVSNEDQTAALPTVTEPVTPERLTDEEIHAMYEAATGRDVDIEMMTIQHNPNGFEGVIFAGDFNYDSGFNKRLLFIEDGNGGYDSGGVMGMSADGLWRNGWEDETARPELAVNWLGIVYTGYGRLRSVEAPEDFATAGKEYMPLTAELQEDGGVLVTLWLKHPEEMVPIRVYSLRQIHFEPSGEIRAAEILDEFEVEY